MKRGRSHGALLTTVLRTLFPGFLSQTEHVSGSELRACAVGPAGPLSPQSPCPHPQPNALPGLPFLPRCSHTLTWLRASPCTVVPSPPQARELAVAGQLCVEPGRATGGHRGAVPTRALALWGPPARQGPGRGRERISRFKTPDAAVKKRTEAMILQIATSV